MVVSNPVAIPRVRPLALVCALLVGGLAACKVDNTPAGGLVLSLETDLAVPKDIDRIELSITQEGRSLLTRDESIGSGHMLLPAELRVAYPGNDRPVLVRATAYHGDAPRIERSAVTPVPRTFLGLLRLPLGYLCDGTALPDGGSSCGEGNTCNLGSCGTAKVNLTSLPLYEPAATRSSAKPAADGGTLPNDVGSLTNAVSGCFDVSSCFAAAQMLDIDLGTCSLRLPPQAASERISVALVLPLGNQGICDNGSCFVPLDLDTGGYSFGDGGEVLLPMGVCDKLLQGLPLRAAISTHCGEKTSKNPPCGAWSSVQTPLPAQSGTTSDTGGSLSGARSGLGEACSGAGRQACGMCGTAGRDCRDGRWDDWGMCAGQGTCMPGASESCGRGGTRTCGGSCEWGACLGQVCNGPTTQACGNCGTQTRSCDNGVWSEWSACDAQGECKPNDTRGCGSSGTQACMGNCRWGSCGNQSCAGAPSEACGNCGTRTRGCDAASGTWLAFGECTGEGACAPNMTRSCGSAGMQACRGDCSWDSACTGQTCTGPATQTCGNCGTQTRTCDTSTGSWSAWSTCSGEGECAPNDARSCGSGGTQVCGGNCRWDAACTGQSCSGAATQACGNCGLQTRTCDANTGTWSAFSACLGQGACQPGSARACGSGGTQTCTAACAWPATCTMQTCTGAASQTCGNCGVQTRACNANTGQFGAWSACTGEKACKPGATQSCAANGGTQTCLDTCDWSATCSCPTGTHLCNGQCVSNTAIGSCGSSCGACPQPAGTVASCDGTSCGLGCAAGQSLCGSSCVNLQTDAAHCGACANSCPAGQTCSAGKCGCPTGQHACNGTCVSNTSPATCGTACTPCTAPAGAAATCNGTSCGFTCASGSLMCATSCANVASDNSNCGRCGVMCSGGAQCTNGQCSCPTGTHLCGSSCVSDTDVKTCGTACTPCLGLDGGTLSCDGKSCVSACPGGTHNCDGSCASDTSITQCGPTCVQCPSITGGMATCSNGSCGFTCSKGLSPCKQASGAMACTDLTTLNDCGACGNVCSPTQVCSAGRCTTLQ